MAEDHAVSSVHHELRLWGIRPIRTILVRPVEFLGFEEGVKIFNQAKFDLKGINQRDGEIEQS